MRDFVAIDKSNRHFSRVITLLMERPEVKLLEFKRVVPRSRWYAVVIKKLLQVNNLLREIDSKLYLAEPTFSITKTREVYTCIKRCDFIEIHSKPGYFIIRWNNEKHKTNTDKSNNRAIRANQEQSDGEGFHDDIELSPPDSIEY